MLVVALALVIFSIRSHPPATSSAIAMTFVGYTNLPGNDLRFALFSVSNQAAYPIRWRLGWMLGISGAGSPDVRPRFHIMSDQGSFKVERWRPDESAASAYLRGGQVILHGSCITTIGQLACEPYRVLSAADSDETLGAAVLEVLAAAKIAQPPIDLKAEEKKILACAGVKSWVKLHEGAVNCHVGMTPQKITVLPTRNERRTFFHVPEQAIKLPVASMPEQVGAALREGFSRCT